MSFLVLDGVAKSYGPVVALAGIDLAISAGSRTAIVGPSGSGKTTLLRLLAGFETPDRGRIVLDGEVLSDAATSIPAHRRSVGVVTQDGSLFPHLTVGANIAFGLPRQMPDRDGRIGELLKLVHLDQDMRTRRPHELSGGQQQRVALARALARRPKLMLLDEPFSALDTALRDSMRTSVAEVLEATRTTAVLVTHDQAEALSFADQVVVLRQGSVAQAGSPADLYWHPADPGVATFIGEAVILPARIRDGVATCVLGRVAVEPSDSKGAARIMLRPEQIRLLPPQDDAAGAPARCRVRVVSSSFGGAAAGLVLTVLSPPPPELAASPGPTTLSLRISGAGCPPASSVFDVALTGPAHAFS